MDINTALDIMYTQCQDYKSTNGRIIDALDIPRNEPLQMYFDLINTDPLQWINSFPSEFKSVQALAKPKSGVLFMLERHDATRNELGIEYCNNLARHITTVWRNNIQNVVEARQMMIPPRVDNNVVLDTTQIDTSDKDRIIDDLNIELNQRNVEIIQKEKDIDNLAIKLAEVKEANGKLLVRMTDLKSIFIDTLRQKGTPDAELALFDRLLRVW
jgi:hypothetical protein